MSDEYVHVGEHAWERWDDRRASNPGYGPAVAWNRAELLPEPHGLLCDEARYRAETDLVFVVGEETDDDGTRTIVTAIRGQDSKPELRSLIEVVAP